MANVKVELDRVTVPLGNNGINLKIADNEDVHVGDLRIGRGRVVWMRGKTTEKNGKTLTMNKFLELLDSIE